MTETTRIREGNVEVSFHLSQEVVKAIKMKAVQEEERFSKTAEKLLRQSLGLKELKEKKSKSTSAH